MAQPAQLRGLETRPGLDVDANARERPGQGLGCNADTIGKCRNPVKLGRFLDKR